ncbi:HNH endonuclease family protein [Corynebacterium gerontici]|uniref:GmrSD restriction endonucleases C-terminal domain-containing protein n=1 Tax=Corynebacterium gerontici TaxID=2079234 RepID=A0A3G6J462_9CORY|nr:HNH endonuclease family protein [Corynebacterium gerontici]AZA11200.1 hypothetical protein CGERO_04415 [Corynebacterium gerontici]
MRRAFYILLVATIVLSLLSLPPLQRLDPAIKTIPEVPERHKVPGYERSNFGDGWATAPGNACDTRVTILESSLFDVHREPSCRLKSGWGVDPYSGNRIGIGTEEAETIELDHVFPLAAAWDLGAAQWDEIARINFANDPLNLVIASKTENQAKSDALPATWLPSKRTNRCWYVNRLIAVAVKYSLPLPRGDVAVMRRQCLLR